MRLCFGRYHTASLPRQINSSNRCRTKTFFDKLWNLNLDANEITRKLGKYKNIGKQIIKLKKKHHKYTLVK